MKCLLTYKLSLSLFSPEITFENTNFSIISRETKTEIMCMSLSMSLRIFVNPGPGVYLIKPVPTLPLGETFIVLQNRLNF